MKNKLFTAASIVAILASSAAYAKTEGGSTSLNILQNQLSTKVTAPADSQERAHAAQNRYGFGVSYKYAFNMDGMFVAPGVYANFNHGDKDSGSKYGYGVRADLGYDINNNVAPYLVVGLGRLNVQSIQLSDTTKAKSFNKSALLLGFGIKTTVTDNIDLNFEYNTQSFNLSNKKVNDLKIHNKLQTVQVGVAYKF
jgi:opacity protein-like surface antigen